MAYLTRTDCEGCGADSSVERYCEHNGWQPWCDACDPLACDENWPPLDWTLDVMALADQL